MENRSGNAKKEVLYEFPPITILEEHIPPPTMSGGSCHLEIKHEMKRQRDTPGARPRNYTAEVPSDAKQYGDIVWLQVLTEIEHGFNYVRYTFPLGLQPQLKIWLQSPISASPHNVGEETDYNSSDLDPDAHILVKGSHIHPDSGLLVMLMQADKEFTREPSGKKDRPHKYKHGGYGRNFRIGKWQVVGSDGTTVIPDEGGDPVEDSEGEGYKLMIGFHNPKTRSSK